MSPTCNCRSAYLIPSLIKKYLVEEVKFGCVASPFSSLPIKGIHVSWFSVIVQGLLSGKVSFDNRFLVPTGTKLERLSP